MRRKISFLAQLEATECGAACVAMLATYHGHALPLREARALCNVSRDGSTALDLLEAAEKLGFEADAFQVSVPDLSSLPLPAIIHWDFNHFVVLERIMQDAAGIVDPAHGRLRVATAELERSVSGVAIVLKPTPRVSPRRPSRTAVGRREYVRALRLAAPSLALALLACALVELFRIAVPLGTKFVFDMVAGSRQTRWLAAAGVISGLAVVAGGILALVPARVLAGLRLLINVRATGAFVDRLMAQDLRFFLQRGSGDIVCRVDASTALASSTLRAATATLDGMVIAAYAVMLIGLELRLGLAVLALSLVRAVVPAVVMARRGETLAAAYMARAKEAGVAWSCLATPEALRASSAEHLIALRFERRAIDRADADAAWRKALDGAGALTPLFDGVLRAVIFGLGGLAASYDHMTLGSLAAFLAIAALLDRPMQALIDALGAFEEIRQQLHRVDEIWDSDVTETKSVARPMLRGHIAFDRVTFRHAPTAAPVVEDVSFEIVPGQCVAIVGRSGAGKSTMASLLLGILSPSEGRVLLDGHDLSQLDIDAVRAQLGVVLQDGHIFARSVRDNVALCDESLPLERITGAARLACIHDEMQALEQGYATKVGAGGVGLSGGQSQRLRLARAVAAGPKILVLDEATSSLDRPLEAAIQAGIDRLDCTRVVIAHRLATVQSADQILVMDRGRLVDRGTFDELAGRPGILREMLDVSFA